MEHLPAAARVNARKVVVKIKEPPTNKSFLVVGRLGARIPLYGPLNCVVRKDAAVWSERAASAPITTTSPPLLCNGGRGQDPRAISKASALVAVVWFNEWVCRRVARRLSRESRPVSTTAVRIFGEITARCLTPRRLIEFTHCGLVFRRHSTMTDAVSPLAVFVFLMAAARTNR